MATFSFKSPLEIVDIPSCSRIRGRASSSPLVTGQVIIVKLQSTISPSTGSLNTTGPKTILAQHNLPPRFFIVGDQKVEMHEGQRHLVIGGYEVSSFRDDGEMHKLFTTTLQPSRVPKHFYFLPLPLHPSGQPLPDRLASAMLDHPHPYAGYPGLDFVQHGTEATAMFSKNSMVMLERQVVKIPMSNGKYTTVSPPVSLRPGGVGLVHTLSRALRYQRPKQTDTFVAAFRELYMSSDDYTNGIRTSSAAFVEPEREEDDGDEDDEDEDERDENRTVEEGGERDARQGPSGGNVWTRSEGQPGAGGSSARGGAWGRGGSGQVKMHTESSTRSSTSPPTDRRPALHSSPSSSSSILTGSFDPKVTTTLPPQWPTAPERVWVTGHLFDMDGEWDGYTGEELNEFLEPGSTLRNKVSKWIQGSNTAQGEVDASEPCLA